MITCYCHSDNLVPEGELKVLASHQLLKFPDCLEVLNKLRLEGSTSVIEVNVNDKLGKLLQVVERVQPDVFLSAEVVVQDLNSTRSIQRGTQIADVLLLEIICNLLINLIHCQLILIIIEKLVDVFDFFELIVRQLFKVLLFVSLLSALLSGQLRFLQGIKKIYM